MYEISSFNKKDGEMIFNINNMITKSINVKEYNDYRKVSPNHYYDIKNDDIVLINNHRVSSILTDIDGSIYRTATQFEFDYWMSVNYPESHNAIVYRYLIE